MLLKILKEYLHRKTNAYKLTIHEKCKNVNKIVNQLYNYWVNPNVRTLLIIIFSIWKNNFFELGIDLCVLIAVIINNILQEKITPLQIWLFFFRFRTQQDILHNKIAKLVGCNTCHISRKQIFERELKKLNYYSNIEIKTVPEIIKAIFTASKAKILILFSIPYNFNNLTEYLSSLTEMLYFTMNLFG